VTVNDQLSSFTCLCSDYDTLCVIAYHRCVCFMVAAVRGRYHCQVSTCMQWAGRATFLCIAILRYCDTASIESVGRKFFAQPQLHTAGWTVQHHSHDPHGGWNETLQEESIWCSDLTHPQYHLISIWNLSNILPAAALKLKWQDMATIS
jgi:hypothetical protein